MIPKIPLPSTILHGKFLPHPSYEQKLNFQHRRRNLIMTEPTKQSLHSNQTEKILDSLRIEMADLT